MTSFYVIHGHIIVLMTFWGVFNVSCSTKGFARPFLFSAWKGFFTSFSSIRLIFPALIISYYVLSFLWIRLFSKFIYRNPVNFWQQSFHALVPMGSEIALFAEVMLVNMAYYHFKSFFWKERPCIPLENGSKSHPSILYVNLIMGMTELIYI